MKKENKKKDPKKELQRSSYGAAHKIAKFLRTSKGNLTTKNTFSNIKIICQPVPFDIGNVHMVGRTKNARCQQPK